MKNQLKLVVLFAVIMLFICSLKSCSNYISDEEVNQYMELYSDVNKKKVVFPKELETIHNNIISSETNKYSIIVTGYLDCSTCIIRLKQIEAFNNEFPNFNIIYIGGGNESIYFLNQIRKNKFSFTILKDKNNDFIVNNELYKYNQSTFLLNSNNEIEFIGEPFYSSFIKSFYTYLYHENY